MITPATSPLCSIAGVTVGRAASPFEYVRYVAGMMIDDDGAGPRQGDPCYQPDTTLHQGGKPLNALVDRYIVVPPLIIHGTRGIVMGCLAQVTRISTGVTVICVVGDEGPFDKIGEVAQSVAQALGIDDNPIHGGSAEKDFLYEIFPGKPAPGYTLQPA